MLEEPGNGVPFGLVMLPPPPPCGVRSTLRSARLMAFNFFLPVCFSFLYQPLANIHVMLNN